MSSSATDPIPNARGVTCTLALLLMFQVTRPSEPWEFSDGAVYLVRELCVVKPEIAVIFFEELADVARLTHFVQADCLRETLWKQVNMAETYAGAQVFFMLLEFPRFVSSSSLS